jgi:hypothetical protein
MAEIGDRIETTSPKSGRRSGVVTGINGPMVTVRWDAGGESGLIPGAGVLSVVGHQAPRAAASKKKRSR